MKTYNIRGGYTVHEQYEITVEANDEEEAKIKAKKIPIEKWDELQKESDSGFVIDDVEEVEE